MIVVGHFSAITQFRLTTINNLAERGHKVHVVVIGMDPRSGEPVIPDGVGISFLTISHQSRNPLLNLKIIAGLAREIRKFQPDAVIGRNAQPLAFLRWARLASRQKPRILALVEGLGPGEGRLVSTLWRMAFPAYEKVVLLNADDREFLTYKGVLTKRNQVHVRHGIGVEHERFGIKPLPEAGKWNLVMIARLVAAKGVQEYIKAADILRNEQGMDICFNLIGGFVEDTDEETRSAIEQAVEKGLVTFHGFQSDVRPFIEQCHINVLPSWYREGLPTTVMEAAAMGRASIITSAPAIRHAVTDATGWHIEPGNAQALAKCIESALTGGDYITKGEAAADYARRHFDRKKFDDFLIEQMLD